MIEMNMFIRVAIVCSIVIVGLLGTSAMAFAAPSEKSDGFVCPVLGGKAGTNGNSGKIAPIAGGYYTIVGPDVTVPDHAMNDGFPSVPDSFLVPGDPGYSAIWNYDNAP
jgi:hypothetical protein